MALIVNAKRGGLKADNAYLYIVTAQVQKWLRPVLVNEVMGTEPAKEWMVLFHLCATEADRLTGRTPIALGAMRLEGGITEPEAAAYARISELVLHDEWTFEVAQAGDAPQPVAEQAAETPVESVKLFDRQRKR